MNVIEELRWRGLISNIVGGTEEQLLKEPTTFYVGTDPTADSLHVGHMCAFVVAKLLQKHGHKPIILLGGATALAGDPSHKAVERPLIDVDTVTKNGLGIKHQIEKIIDFNSGKSNVAELVNNYDWMKDYSFINFIRDVGKYMTVNYMMSKDSVRMRLEREGVGLSFTEFSYGLLQPYDFLHLHQEKNCKMQIGGSDQWGNITSGQELIRKKLGGDADTFAFVWPLVTRADGVKFGKSEGGKNIWLDPKRTSPYEFYQFWLNSTDDDIKRYIRIFSSLSKDEIEALEKEHDVKPQLRILQKQLAKELTIMIHSEKDYEMAIAASNILFSNDTSNVLKEIDEDTLLSVFNGVPTFGVSKEHLINGVKLTDLTVDHAKIFKSKGELRKLINSGGISLNKEKVTNTDTLINVNNLLNDKYLLIQKGKRSYNLIVAE